MTGRLEIQTNKQTSAGRTGCESHCVYYKAPIENGSLYMFMFCSP